MKIVSLLRDAEYIIRHKQLAIASMNNLQKVWIGRDCISDTGGL